MLITTASDVLPCLFHKTTSVTIKVREALRFTGTPCQVTISKRAEKYFASVLVDTRNYDLKALLDWHVPLTSGLFFGFKLGV